MTTANLTKAQRDAVEVLAWAMHHFGSLLTGRGTKRKTVLALVALGIAESAGMVEQCDGDGFHIQNRRLREGFRLTARGIDVAKAQGCYYAKRLVAR